MPDRVPLAFVTRPSDGAVTFGTLPAGLEINDSSTAAFELGYLQSANVSPQRDKYEGRDENGNVNRLVFYNPNGEAQASLKLIEGATIPEFGDTLTVFGYKAYIETVNISASNTDEVTVDITGHWYGAIDSPTGEPT